MWAQRRMASALAVALTGCSTVGNLRDSKWVSAEPLDGHLVASILGPGRLAGAASAPTDRGTSAPTTTKIDAWALVNDSADKCRVFADKITASQTQLHATGDLASLLFSTLGTLFHAANTVRALSAGATASTGATAALDTDLFAKSGFSAFRLALQSTYDKRLDDYKKGLESLDDSDFDAGAELLKIKSIHALCGLAPVEGSILASVTPAASAPSTKAPGGGASAASAASAVSDNDLLGFTFGSKATKKQPMTSGAISGLPIR